MPHIPLVTHLVPISSNHILSPPTSPFLL